MNTTRQMRQRMRIRMSTIYSISARLTTNGPQLCSRWSRMFALGGLQGTINGLICATWAAVVSLIAKTRAVGSLTTRVNKNIRRPNLQTTWLDWMKLDEIGSDWRHRLSRSARECLLHFEMRIGRIGGKSVLRVHTFRLLRYPIVLWSLNYHSLLVK